MEQSTTKKSTTAKVEKEETVKTTAAKKAEEKKTTAAKKTEEKKETAAKKAEEKKETTGTAKKAATKTTTKTAAKTTKATAKVTTKVVVQYSDREDVISEGEYRAKVEEIWTKEWGKAKKDLKDIAFYVKPEEGKVYFVVNESAAGDFNL